MYYFILAYNTPSRYDCIILGYRHIPYTSIRSMVIGIQCFKIIDSEFMNL